jgi:hypothetical protein
LDATSKTQTEVKLFYNGIIVAWFGFLFVGYKTTPPHRNVSALVLVAFCLAAGFAIVIGFILRKKLFKQSTDALSGNPRKALYFWRGGNLIGWCCAIDLAIFGVALKFLGSSSLVLGVFLAVSLGFLLLWRPRPLIVNSARTAR